MRFWKMITASTSGIVMTTDAALIVPSGISNFWLPVKFATETGTVNAFGELVGVCASRNSFQTKKAVRRPAVTSPGDQRRLLELLRDLLKERGEDVDRERKREGEVRQDQPDVRVVEPDLGPELEDRRGDRDRRERRDRQDDRQEQELAWEAQARQCVGRERADDQGQDRRDTRHDDAVAQRRCEVAVLEDRVVVVERGRRGEEVGLRQVRSRLQRHVDQPVEREEAEDADENDRQPHEQRPDPPTPRPAPLERAGLLALLLLLTHVRAGGDYSARGLHHVSSASDLMFPPTVRM